MLGYLSHISFPVDVSMIDVIMWVIP